MKAIRKTFIGQAGLEYLITYGWALVVVSAIVGVLVLLTTRPTEATVCGNFDNFLVKSAKADTEKIQLVVQNLAGGKIDGLKAYEGIVYGSADSPPLFQINAGDATVGSVTNTVLSNDYVIDYLPGYKEPLNAGSQKTVVIPWPVSGFAGQEYGADGCGFLTDSLGKQFSVVVTVYYRNFASLLKEETATCSGIIQSAETIDFPPEAWEC